MEFALFLIVLIFQSSAISFFYTLFFSAANKGSAFVKTALFMMLAVYPLSVLIPESMMIGRNMLNCMLELFFLKHLYKKESWNRIVFGVLLCQTALVVSEILGAALFYFIMHRTPDVSEFSRQHMSDMLSMYLLDSCLLLIVLCILNRMFSKVDLIGRKMSGYLFSLLLNLVLVALCACYMFEPFDVLFFLRKYWIVLLFLLVLNVCTFLSLFRYVRKEKEKRAMDILETEYARQLIEYAAHSTSEQTLRQFRHDLLNYVESIKKRSE